MRATITITQIADPVKLALLRRALADRLSHEPETRRESCRFVARITSPTIWHMALVQDLRARLGDA